MVGAFLAFERRHDIQHNNIQNNDIQHNDIQHNDIQHNDIQHRGLICGTQHKWHAAKKTLSIIKVP
jgi:hypothetical protein